MNHPFQIPLLDRLSFAVVVHGWWPPQKSLAHLKAYQLRSNVTHPSQFKMTALLRKGTLLLMADIVLTKDPFLSCRGQSCGEMREAHYTAQVGLKLRVGYPDENHTIEHFCMSVAMILMASHMLQNSYFCGSQCCCVGFAAGFPIPC